MKVVVADDSAIVRAIIEQNLKKEKNIEIIASVSNGRKALDVSKRLSPDVVILDTKMPEMDGIEATKLLAEEGISVYILAENQTEITKAKANGAKAAELKPSLNNYNSFLPGFIQTLKEISSKSKSKSHDNSSAPETDKFEILCIGASTGGPTAVKEVLCGLGKNFPLPILYAQHIEVGADEKMAQWLNENCNNLTIRLAKDEEEALPGTVYMAPADKHLVINYVKSNGNPVINLSNDPPVRFLRPAVDKLFFSVAQMYKNNCLAVLLTGMGRDGAEGCKGILDIHGYTIVEDESTCAVFGMPAAAIEVGGAKEILPRNKIASRILELIGDKHGNKR